LKIALDATYSVGNNLSGVGVYSREVLWGLPAAHPEARFLFCYRPHRFFRSFGGFLPSGARRAFLFDRRSLDRPDLFHGMNQRLPQVRYPRTVSTFHDLFVLTGDYSTPEFRARFAAQARDAAARSDLIIAVSQFTATQIEDLLRVPSARLRVVPHGVRFHPDKEAAVKREKIVLFAGAIQKRKNIARLVTAFEAMEPGWKLVLAGSHGYGSAEILDRIDRSPRRLSIHTPGYVTDAQLRALYGRASMFVFPSLDEGFGIPVLEAMANGVAVITSNRSSLPEVAGDAAILVDPENDEELLFAMKTLASQDGLRRELVVRGAARAAQYTWQRAVQSTWNVYQELLA
jgi:glycosyltransferase involved in cell wall biosynthesis